MKKILLSVLLGAMCATSALAEDLAVKVEHEMSVLGADGVTRITRFGERLIRQGNQSWVARIVPPGAHEAGEHAAGSENHKHLDLSAASRWVLKDEDGKLRVRVVSDHDKLVIDIPKVDYPNIGFDGNWFTASQFLDPAQIKRMKPSTRSAPVGARWYEGGTQNARVQVLWDEKALYPRRIESSNPSGTSHSSMVVSREAMPASLPWTRLAGYAQKEYSDLLD